jgi:pilus assembly protein CpaF
MLMALNAGCSGLATLHANSARDALDKLVSYCVLAGQNVAIPFVRQAVAAVTDLVVFVRRTPRGRVVEEIASIPAQLAGDVFTTETLFRRVDGRLRWTGVRPQERGTGRMERPA